ncbi:MAG: hypothetical protein Ta2G_10000 [Termitinemataceae bacterium]|nr:MAG: hypothetical protein Ta2G_10000 [Termitinemataceae bacterium]
MIHKTIVTIMIASFFCAATVSADSGSVQSGVLQDELSKIRAVLSRQSISAQEKHDAWAQLGRILQLSGDVEGAAAAWESAAFAVPDKRDDVALLENAACLMAMGEWDKAEAGIKIVLLTTRGDRRAEQKAKYLNAQVEAFRSGNATILETFTENPDYVPVRPALYYTLWKITGNNEYKARLITEYPQSPETRTLFIDGGAGILNAISVSPSAYWMLFPGRENVRIETLATAPASAPAGSLELGVPLSLQIGVFTSRENAAEQVNRLQAAGFSAAITQRTIAGAAYWAVAVPSGANATSTTNRLRAAGFEAYPVF